MPDHVWETHQFLARFRQALAYLETCDDLTLAQYREVWRLTGAGVEDAQLVALWQSRELLALRSGDPDSLRSFTRDSLTRAIAEFEESLRSRGQEGGPPVDPDDEDECVLLADAEHHTRTGIEVIWEMYRRGEYQQALARASIMPAGVRNHLGEDDPLYARVLLALTEFYDELGEYLLADRTARSLLTLLERQGRVQQPLYASALCLLAAVRQKTGDQHAAEELLQRARRLWQDSLDPRDPAHARCLQQLADLHAARGESALAGGLLRAACDVAQAVSGEESAAYATALSHQAEHLRRERHWDASERLHRQALAIRQAILREAHPHCAENLHALGLISGAQGRFAEAHEYIRKALSIRRAVLGDQHPLYGDTLEDLATVKAAQGQAGEALPLFREALEVDDQAIGQVFALVAERQKLEYMAARMRRLNRYLSLVVALGCPPSEAPLAFSFVLRRKGLVAEAVARQRDAIHAARRPDLRDRLAEITRLREFSARRSYAGPQDGESAEDYRRVLVEISRRRDVLEAELAREVPDLDVARQMGNADERTVAALLPAESRLVEFLRVDSYDFTAIVAQGAVCWKSPIYLAFMLDPTGAVQLFDLGEAEPIDRLIRSVRDRFIDEAQQDTARDMVKATPLPAGPPADRAERALRSALFDPLETHFHGRKRLILAPDGDLTRLPVEILPTDDGRRLIDDYLISYVGCARDILRFPLSSGDQAAAALVVADPDFDLRGEGGTSSRPWPSMSSRLSRDAGQADLSFGRLPGTRREGEEIARLLQVRPWLQAAVLEQPLKQLRSPWILHLATHGFFLADQHRDAHQRTWTAHGDMGRLAGLHLENPLLRSGLALAGGNTWLQQGPLPPEAEDGLLTAEDVTGMDLLDTELVVLSACDTGLGAIRTGEGVYGLRRAFVLAGAKTLVMSLWKVPDEETQELMEDFYRRILDGEPRAAALRSAQLAIKARQPHPFFWGAFICYGNPGPLSPQRP